MTTSPTHSIARPTEYLPAGLVTIERDLTFAERDPENKGRQVAVRYVESGQLFPIFDLSELSPILVVARDRDESDSCQAGTPGCCVDHSNCEHGCETW